MLYSLRREMSLVEGMHQQGIWSVWVYLVCGGIGAIGLVERLLAFWVGGNVK